MKDIEELLKINDKSGKIFKGEYIRSNYTYIYNEIIKYCDKNKLIDIPFNQKMYHYHNNIVEIKKCYCGNQLNFINFNKGYSKFCSTKCAHNSIDVIKKTKDTLLEKYGVDNLQKSKEIREKAQQTNIERYGVKQVSKSKEIQNKIKQTNVEKNGVEFPSQNSYIKEKIQKTIIDKSVTECEDLINIDYKNNSMLLKCDFGENHNFTIDIGLFQNRKRANMKFCTVCNTKIITQSELDFLKLFHDDVINKNKDIADSLDVNVYIPELKLAFEFNDLNWHNELNKGNKYHVNKTEEFEKNGIQLIYVWEDDWKNKQDIIRSMILHKLGKSNKIYARKTKIKEVTDNNIVKEFLNKNHIQGYVGGKIKIGLYYNEELISLMVLGNRRVAMGKKSTNDGEYELLRFCGKLNTNVIGGASKLFNYFIKNYNPIEITTYADRSFSQGNLYKQLGFKYIGKTQPNYYYVIDGIKKHRFNFRKDVLVKQGFDPNKTEIKIMLDRNIYRIFDSGNLKFIWNE